MSIFKSNKKWQKNISNKVFQNLDKIILLQEARYFSSSRVNPRKCIHILTKILYLLYQGEPLSNDEATDIFFSTTKLFQTDGIILRRLVYLSLKELSLKSQDVIIVTSSLTKDLSGKEDLLRAAAIRALCTIIDSTMLQGIERYMKEAIVDKNPAVSSAALVSALHQSATVPDLVRHWVNEAQEVIMSDNIMVSYHALGLVASIRGINQISMAKLVTKLFSERIQSPYTLCLLIRYAAKLANEDESGLFGTYIKFIESCLRHKAEIIVYEALHAIIYLCNTAKKLNQVMSVLKNFWLSPNATVRLAGARSLAIISFRHPGIVKLKTINYEKLLMDPNSWVATMTLITIFSTGTPSTIKQIMAPLSSYMTDMQDESKIFVLKAINRLFSKYPRNYPKIFGEILGEMLRNEGSMEFKDAIINAMIPVIEGGNYQVKENGLIQLCEFIEDCEQKDLVVRILQILGREGPKTKQPSRFIRYIYNRVILESPSVRAAAVTSFARLGAAVPELLSCVKVMLTRCQFDECDEVRDRAVFYKEVLELGDPDLINDFITNVQVFNVAALEKALFNHLSNDPDVPFDISVVPVEEKQRNVDKTSEPFLEFLEERNECEPLFFPGMEIIGSLFKSCEPVHLTESGTEYRVCCIKHVFARHLLLQFECLNTLCDRLLENVHIVLGLAPGYCQLAETICEQLKYDQPENIYLLLEFPKVSHETPGIFTSVLEFTVRNCDPVNNNSLVDFNESYRDEYLLENIKISCGDQFIMHEKIDDWQTKWENASRQVKVSETFGLTHKDMKKAANAVREHLHLPKSSIEGEDINEIHAIGMWRTKVPVLIKVRLVLTQGMVTVQMCVRSPREDIASLLFLDLLPGAFVLT